MISEQERQDDLQTAVRTVVDGTLANVWTALPGQIVSFDSAALTAVVQPTIKGIIQLSDGKYIGVQMPQLLDVPVVFPRGGGATLTFPIAAGDEVLVIFSSRSIDAWWQSGGVQMPTEDRKFSLSDAFAIPGPFSQAQKITGWSPNEVQLRSNDGLAFFSVKPSDGSARIVAPGGLTIVADITHTGSQNTSGSLDVGGDVDAGGTVSADEVEAGGVELTSHLHTQVQSGGSNSGPPLV